MTDEVKIIKKLEQLEVPQAGEKGSLRTVANSDEEAKTIFLKVGEVIWRSFAIDIQREPFAPIKPTRSETKRRFMICEAWLQHSRLDLGYSLEKALDLMHHALRSELDGLKFDPEKPDSRIWTPT